ncbi:hypothetical protein U5801_21390 [Lamprobacter modestohalophilus]|uniref:hypothetical protein n=1 Tax=Lamprobacter modestohalophilus TaxID=1064514 RepID=UPI002ADEB9CA|nr:hypothetical protein [Lamprobacter modestohalophilus]MEA1052339.1 hypothetical protein [Lamprobacter modestohalophilus]
MTNASSLPATTNRDWGFFGTLGEQAEAAWPIATRAIAKATGMPIHEIQPFLDSRQGRHFADDVCNALFEGCALEAAIEAAIHRWMGWTINRTTERTLGIPRGLPYLTGFVGHCAILAEQEMA